MQKHVKIYTKYFDYGEQDVVPCENCSSPGVDIHHLIYRSKGGSNNVENLMALCRVCHNRGHDNPSFNEHLKELHLKFMKR